MCVLRMYKNLCTFFWLAKTFKSSQWGETIYVLVAYKNYRDSQGLQIHLNCWWRHATLFDLFVFIVQYEDMSRRIHCLHCLACWPGLDVSWSRIEVGLLVVCWEFGSLRSKSVEKLPNFPPAGLEPMPHVQGDTFKSSQGRESVQSCFPNHLICVHKSSHWWETSYLPPVRKVVFPIISFAEIFKSTHWREII